MYNNWPQCLETQSVDSVCIPGACATTGEGNWGVCLSKTGGLGGGYRQIGWDLL
jgi:hypothetical protein